MIMCSRWHLTWKTKNICSTCFPFRGSRDTEMFLVVACFQALGFSYQPPQCHRAHARRTLEIYTRTIERVHEEYCFLHQNSTYYHTILCSPNGAPNWEFIYRRCASNTAYLKFVSLMVYFPNKVSHVTKTWLDKNPTST